MSLTLCRRNHRRPNWQAVAVWTRSHRRSTRLFNAWLEGKRDKMLALRYANCPLSQAVLILRDFEQFSMEEIARLVRSTVPTVKRGCSEHASCSSSDPRANMSALSQDSEYVETRSRRRASAVDRPGLHENDTPFGQ